MLDEPDLIAVVGASALCVGLHSSPGRLHRLDTEIANDNLLAVSLCHKTINIVSLAVSSVYSASIMERLSTQTVIVKLR